MKGTGMGRIGALCIAQACTAALVSSSHQRGSGSPRPRQFQSWVSGLLSVELNHTPPMR